MTGCPGDSEKFLAAQGAFVSEETFSQATGVGCIQGASRNEQTSRTSSPASPAN